MANRFLVCCHSHTGFSLVAFYWKQADRADRADIADMADMADRTDRADIADMADRVGKSFVWI